MTLFVVLIVIRSSVSVYNCVFVMSFWCNTFPNWHPKQLGGKSRKWGDASTVHGQKRYFSVFDVMFKKRAGVFYRVFDPIKHVLRVFWTASKTFLEKRVSREFITIMLLWTLEISIREKHRKSRAVSLYLIKHRILIRMRFIDIKSLHVMYYLPFDRLMGLWIINEFWTRFLNILVKDSLTSEKKN